ncbi:MAG: LiaF transmembrane domain-containing protein [Chloroflexota bacterium]
MNETETRRRRHRPGLFFPLVLITVGLLLLLQNLNVLNDNIWNLLWKCWPVLLIWIGLDSLFDRHGVAGPVFFIGIGTVFLLSNFNILTWNSWDLIFQLWPVMLIAWGLDLVFGNRSVWGSVLAVILLGAIVVGVLAVGGAITPGESETIHWKPENKVALLEAELQPAVGSLDIGSLSDSANLVEGIINYRKGSSIVRTMTASGSTARFNLALTGQTVVNPLNQASLPDWEVDFATTTPLDLKVSIGVGTADLDLRELDLEALNVDVGIGRSEIMLPAATFDASVEGAIGETVLVIPEDVAVIVIADTGIANLSLPPGFEETAHDEYRYRGDAADLPVITLRVDQGIGRLAIEFGR